MTFLRILVSRIRALLHLRDLDSELDQEIQSHLHLLEQEYLAQGMNATDARYAARRSFGAASQMKEEYRDQRGMRPLEILWQDLRYSIRALTHSPGFTIVAILTLALGIGVNTAIFTLVNGILLKKLPLPDANRVVQIQGTLKTFHITATFFSFPQFEGLRAQSDIFSDVIGFSGQGGLIDLGGDLQKVDFNLVTGNYFSFFKARPALGRLLNEDDDRIEGQHSVCVLSYQTWQNRFGGNPAVIHRLIHVEGASLEVVGVAPPDFVGGELQMRYDFWAPTSMTQALANHSRAAANYAWICVLAKLKPGISLSYARARVAAASQVINRNIPQHGTVINAGIVYQFVDASKGFDSWRTRLRQPLFILMGAVTIVLLIACTNLANLLLARASERQKEFAVKLSLGISRWRLLRQLLLETALLASTGGVAGLVGATALLRILLHLFSTGSYADLRVSMDRQVFAFTFLVCVLTSLLSGLYPAWSASKTDTAPALKGSGWQGPRLGLMRKTLIVAQICLAVVLLFSGSLFLRSLQKLRTISLGYDIDHVLTISLSPRGPRRAEFVVAPPVLTEVLDRVRQLPGVKGAASSDFLPLAGNMMRCNATARDASGRAMEQNDLDFMSVTPGYLSTLQMPLLRGRDFSEADRQGSPPVAIVNQRLASLLWPGEDPLGKHLDAYNQKDIEVVGLAANSKYTDIRESAQPVIYFALNQEPSVGGNLFVRTAGRESEIERQIARIVRSNAPDYEISSVRSMKLLHDNLISQDRALTFLSVLFGLLGTALALVGLYGLISYSVTRRTREIGVRVAAGAQRVNILMLFLREAVLLLALGVLAGLPLALLLAEPLKTLLYSVPSNDPVGMLLTLSLLALSSFAASLLPARRATKVDPMEALRYE